MGLSSVEVISILEASAKSGVSVLKFGDLYVKFGKQTEPDSSTLVEPQASAQSYPVVGAMTALDRLKAAKAALLRDEMEIREQQLEELKITDPLEYERQINDGELEDDTDESANDDQPE